MEMLELLSSKLDRDQRRLRHYNNYYEGEQPLKFLALELKAEFGDRLAEVVINWAKMVAGAYDDRLDPTWFSFPDSTSDGVDFDKAESDLWGIWEENDMVRKAQQAHLDSIVMGRSYAIGGPRSAVELETRDDSDSDGEDDEDDDSKIPHPFDEALSSPLITVESALQCITEDDPRTRRPIAGLKKWKDRDKVTWATLYLPARTQHYQYARKWKLVDEDNHKLGVPPIWPIINRERLLDRTGRSEFKDIIPIADAANKMATDMMVSGEFHAMPRRYSLGMGREDFVDQDGKQIGAFEQLAGRLWATRKKPSEVELGTFTESDLAVFHNTLKLLSDIALQLSGLPAQYGYAKENPPSADALRASESRLVKGVERMQTGFGADWRMVMAIATLIRDGKAWDSRILRAKTLWRDAATPTVAQVADATTKKFQVGIATKRQARVDCGYSPQVIKRMEKEDEEEAKRDPLKQLVRSGLPGGGNDGGA